MKCKLSKLTYLPNNKHHILNVNELQYNSKKNELTCALIDLITYGRKKNEKANREWYNMNMEDITLKKFNLLQCITQSSLIFSTGIIENIQLLGYKDKRYPSTSKKDSQLPMQAIKQLPFRFHSDSILINNGTITYSEREDKSLSPGTITFNHIQSKLINLSTIPELINGPTKLYSKTKIMNQGELKASFVFPNDKFRNKYSIQGHMNSISMKTFNSFIEQNAGISITSGKIKNAEFNFSYDQNKSTGNLNLEYQNLEVVALQLSKSQKQYIKSFMLNKILIHKENISNSESYRKGKIYFLRNKKKSIFNYWWHSILSGISSVVIN